MDFQSDFGEKSPSCCKCPKNSKEIRKKIVKHCNRLPREVVQSLYLEVLKDM